MMQSSSSEVCLPVSFVPPVTPNTHIIALLGPDNADPCLDGWMAADFCLLNYLLDGCGKSQAWFTSLDFGRVVHEFGPVLHGNPHRPRQVVCGSAEELHHLHRTEKGLRLSWLEYLGSIIQTADDGDHILVILIGHGEQDDGSPFIVGDEELSQTDIWHEICGCGRPLEALRWTFTMTSCYSGGWTTNDLIASEGVTNIDQRLNATMMTAAQWDEESNNVPRSASGRYAGGVFMQALTNELVESGSLASTDGTTYRTWCDNITTEMDRLFHVGATPAFAARDQSWNTEYEQATGIQRSSYRERFAALPLRAPNPDEHGRGAESILSASNPVLGRLRALCGVYLAIRPGLDTAASNTYISALVEQCINPYNRFTRPFTYKDAMFLASRLPHRIGLAYLAERYIALLHLSPFRAISMFDEHLWRKDAGEHRQLLYRRAHAVVCRFDKGQLFPRGPMKRGEDFSKPRQYLAAAFADKGLDDLEVSLRLSSLRDTLERPHKEV